MSDNYFSENYGGGSGILYLASGYVPTRELVAETHRVGRTEGTVSVKYTRELHRVEDELGRTVDDLSHMHIASISGVILSREAASLFADSGGERSVKVSAAYVADSCTHYVYGSLYGDEVLLYGKDAHGYEFEVRRVDYLDGTEVNGGTAAS